MEQQSLSSLPLICVYILYTLLLAIKFQTPRLEVAKHFFIGRQFRKENTLICLKKLEKNKGKMIILQHHHSVA